MKWRVSAPKLKTVTWPVFLFSVLFTRPMMVITQKITSMAFEIHDGKSSVCVPSARASTV